MITRVAAGHPGLTASRFSAILLMSIGNLINFPHNSARHFDLKYSDWANILILLISWEPFDNLESLVSCYEVES